MLVFWTRNNMRRLETHEVFVSVVNHIVHQSTRREAVVSAMNHIIHQNTVYEATVSSVNHILYQSITPDAIVSPVTHIVHKLQGMMLVSPLNRIVHYPTIYGMKFCVRCESFRTSNYGVASYSIRRESYYTPNHSA